MHFSWFRWGIVALLAAVAVWGYGFVEGSGGNDLEEMCEIVHGQTFDWEYRQREWSGPQPLYPIHNMCNEHYDLVPGWINPTIAVLALSGSSMLFVGLVSAASTLRRRAE